MNASPWRPPRQEMVSLGERNLTINDSIKNNTVISTRNSVTTSKYTTLTFFPIFIHEQFLARYANIFFLVTGLIQLIPDVSPTSKYGTLFPLSIILGFTALKEILEDSKRHVQDAKVNTRICKTLSGSTFVDREWQHLRVGDIVRVANSEFFPADLVLLSSSEPDALCYIETSNLDGETNLKMRQGLAETAFFITPEAVSRIKGIRLYKIATIRCEVPNNSLYTFDATLTMNGADYPLSPDQLLLRGAQLRNTRWAYGTVVFNGPETKLMMNSTKAPNKRTKVELMVNYQMVMLFLALLIMAIICSTGEFLTYRLKYDFAAVILFAYDEIGIVAFIHYGMNILTFIVLFNYLLPLSLIVTMEFVKFAIASFIDNDLEIYDESVDVPAQARTSSLVEELGQIDYLFSDKTGTLTRNIMEFKMISVGGVPYAETVPDDKRIRLENGVESAGYYNFNVLKSHQQKNQANSRIIHEFLVLLSICHTVIPEHDENNAGSIIYQASSPDEAALVDGARNLGYLFHTRKPKSVTISVNGVNLVYEILNLNEFNSTRKRMSVVARNPDGQIKLYVKGADNVIFERLAADNPCLGKTVTHLEEYASEGLRTLCIAYRDISDSEYVTWKAVYDSASTSLINRQSKLDEAAELIENNLTLLGATAIEDKLQEGVPDTIHTLMEAGIKVWVLTGDRQETAINIGYSCKLIDPDMNVLLCNEASNEGTKTYLEQKLINVRGGIGLLSEPRINNNWWERFWMNSDISDNGKFSKNFGEDIDPIVLVIDGKSLNFALEDDIKEIFLELAILCKSVICCRVSPLQKALVVKLVKDHVAQSVTCAIGDGANDVSMIQAAHVGIGISGQEGLQAARAADFSISQFQYLRKLILIHGGWAYSRITKVVTYSFYKNITLQLLQFWFALHNGYSGQTLFETWSSLSTYNVIWTMVPPFMIGIFDQFLNSKTLQDYPHMYRIGQKDILYNNKVFAGVIGTAVSQSLIMFLMWRGILGESVLLGDGRVIDIWAFGAMIYVTDLMSVTMKACLMIDSWVSFTAYVLFGSLAAFFVVFPCYSIIGVYLNISPQLYNINYALFEPSVFWLGIILVPVTANLRDLTWKYFEHTFLPKPYHIAQEIQKYNLADYRPRAEWFRKAVHKVRQYQRVKMSRGFAFSQNESGQASLIRAYDTTKRKPKG